MRRELFELIRYVIEMIGVGGLISVFAFVKWSNVALGAVLSVVGAFFPAIRGRREPEEKTGEGHVTFGTLAVVVRGGARFAVVVAGIVLIVGGIVQGYQDSEKQKAKEALAEQQQQQQRLNQIQTTLTKIKQTNSAEEKAGEWVPPADKKKVADVERLIDQACRSCEQQIKRLEPIATGSAPPTGSMQPSAEAESREHPGDSPEP